MIREGRDYPKGAIEHNPYVLTRQENINGDCILRILRLSRSGKKLNLTMDEEEVINMGSFSWDTRLNWQGP